MTTNVNDPRTDAHAQEATVNRSTIGWLFVAVQFALLGALALLPAGDAWPRPDWLRALGLAAMAIGLGIVAVAALRLGPALTATPVPTRRSALITGGLYRWARHPIYAGVLLIVAGVALRSGSLATVGVAIALVLFFLIKSSWEEQRLRDRYPDYDRYAATVGRFGPRLARRGGRAERH
ncbi:MAG: isoprenylcysteine carboxylmethyltransferase family protein [Actinomycetota bacterium]